MPMMTKERLCEVIGDLPDIDYQDLLFSANADPEEGVEWMPYYKAAMALLAEECGTMAGSLVKLKTAYGDSPAGLTIDRILLRCKVLWEAHLKLIRIGPQQVTQVMLDQINQSIEETSCQ